MLHVHMDGIVFGKQKRGGISRVFQNLLVAFGRRRDLRVHLYLPREAPRLAWLPEAIQVVTHPRPVRWRPGRVFEAMNRRREARCVDRLWGQIDSGIFHSTYYSTYPSLHIPQVFSLQDMIYERFPECFPHERAARHVEDKTRCVHAAAAVVTPSRSAMEDAARVHDLNGKMTAVVPYTVEPLFHPDRPEEQRQAFRDRFTDGAPFVLFVGSRRAHKNFVGLLAAYARWPGGRSCRLLAVGGGEPRDYELSMVRCLGVNGRVHFCPDFADDELALAYSSARALVVPALCEGFGLPLLEGMASGTPVASSTGGSLPEVGRETAVYFDPQDIDQMTQALDEVAQVAPNSERVQDGIRRARERTWADVAEDYVKVYRLAMG